MTGERIDWNRVHERIAETNAAIGKGFAPGPEKIQEILKARACELAREPRRDDAEHVEIVEFMLANERYGLESCYVREVYPLKDYTPLPCTPSFVLGLINVRGANYLGHRYRKSFRYARKRDRRVE
jgi:purine-binding chemotaxis protein CheW